MRPRIRVHLLACTFMLICTVARGEGESAYCSEDRVPHIHRIELRDAMAVVPRFASAIPEIMRERDKLSLTLERPICPGDKFAILRGMNKTAVYGSGFDSLGEQLEFLHVLLADIEAQTLKTAGQEPHAARAKLETMRLRGGIGKRLEDLRGRIKLRRFTDYNDQLGRVGQPATVVVDGEDIALFTVLKPKGTHPPAIAHLVLKFW